MRRPLRGIACVFCVLGVASCDPGFELRGHVTDARGKPIADVKARVVCDGRVQCSAVSDEGGRFSGRAIGWRPNTCNIELDAPGLAAIRLTMKDHCAEPHGDDACLGVWLDVIVP